MKRTTTILIGVLAAGVMTTQINAQSSPTNRTAVWASPAWSLRTNQAAPPKQNGAQTIPGNWAASPPGGRIPTLPSQTNLSPRPSQNSLSGNKSRNFHPSQVQMQGMTNGQPQPRTVTPGQVGPGVRQAPLIRGQIFPQETFTDPSVSSGQTQPQSSDQTQTAPATQMQPQQTSPSRPTVQSPSQPVRSAPSTAPR